MLCKQPQLIFTIFIYESVVVSWVTEKEEAEKYYKNRRKEVKWAIKLETLKPDNPAAIT